MGRRGIALILVCLLAAPLLAARLSAVGAVPANDDFDAAAPLGALPFRDRRDVRGATRAPDDPAACGRYETSVWYRFVPTVSGRVRIDTDGSTYATVLAGYTGARGRLTATACAGGTGRYANEILFDVRAGRVYHLLVGAMVSGGSPQKLALRVRAVNRPPNDTVERATPVPTLPVTFNQEVTGATFSATDRRAECDDSRSANVWYQITLPRTTLLYATTNIVGTNYDTMLALFVRRPGGLREVNCNGFGGEADQADLSFVAEAGVTYYLMVANEGSYTTTDHLALSIFED